MNDIKRPLHIQKLFDEIDKVRFDSPDYWKLRATYREKMDDLTYSLEERQNCFQLWRELLSK